MTNPRNTIKFNGIGYSAQTFYTDETITYDREAENGSAQAGLAVTLSDDATVGLAGAGDLVLGKLLKVESDGKATVQTGGYVALPAGEGATIAAGDQVVGAAGPGGVLGYVNGGTGRGIVVDASDTAAVWVRLD